MTTKYTVVPNYNPHLSIVTPLQTTDFTPGLNFDPIVAFAISEMEFGVSSTLFGQYPISVGVSVSTEHEQVTFDQQTSNWWVVDGDSGTGVTSLLAYFAEQERFTDLNRLGESL